MAHGPNGAKSVGPHAVRTDSHRSAALSHSLFPKKVLTLRTDFSELHSLIGLEDPGLDVSLRLRIDPLQKLRLHAGRHLDEPDPRSCRRPYFFDDRPEPLAVAVALSTVLRPPLHLNPH